MHGAQNEQLEILRTKITPPGLHPPYVVREALLARLDQAVARPLTLISAPAGFGKTTLVSEWITTRREQRTLPLTAWVSLDPEDNDPVRFWRYVLTASREFDPEVSAGALGVLANAPQPPFETLLTMFINQAAQLEKDAVLILDDFHLINSPVVLETFTFLIDHLPEALHLILLTRSDPALPLARLRAHNRLNELRLADLRFTDEEVQAFFNQTLPYRLDPGLVSLLSSRTEGWGAGLRLVLFSLQGRSKDGSLEQFIHTFTGSHRSVMDYLIEDVFASQPQPVQDFLLKTSVLRILNGSLCNAVTGREDSDQILEQLERANLFLMPLDRAGRWYRFHALFSEAMKSYARQRMGEAALLELAVKASRWFEEHGMLAEAIEAALYGRDFSHAAGLIERFITPRLVQNEFHTLRRWMEQLPEEVLHEHPAICMTFATAILFTSDRHAPETRARLQLPVQIAGEYWQRQNDQHRLGEVLAFRSLVEWLQRDYSACFRYARQALSLLPQTDLQWGGISLIMTGVEEMLSGRLHTARQQTEEALKRNQAAENSYGSLDSMLLLGEICYQQGELYQAQEIYRQVLAGVEDAPMDRMQASIRRARALLGLGMLALEWNNLEEAEDHLTQAYNYSRQFADEDLLLDAPVFLARVKFARGEVEQAQQLLEALIVHITRPFLFRFPRLELARMALASGDASTAVRRLAAGLPSGEMDSAIQREQQALLAARLQIAQGAAGDALPQLTDWLEDAQSNGRTRSEIEVLNLLALAHANLGAQHEAVQALIQALAVGQPARFQRIFIDEGDRLALILRQALPEIRSEPVAVFARGLLYAISQERSKKEPPLPQTTPSDLLIEPLSEQEQRVLRLLAAGLSNPEIAGELVISINTVKTHVKNIYAKLGVSSRKEARQAANQLNLL